ncbi:hypothetical protein ACU4HD_25365 [Cupriavidus basilensis]
MLCAQRAAGLSRCNIAATGGRREETVGLIEQAGGYAAGGAGRCVERRRCEDRPVRSGGRTLAGRAVAASSTTPASWPRSQDVADMTTHRLRTMFETNVLGALW